jgi:hypothetical protein
MSVLSDASFSPRACGRGWDLTTRGPSGPRPGGGSSPTWSGPGGQQARWSVVRGLRARVSLATRVTTIWGCLRRYRQDCVITIAIFKKNATIRNGLAKHIQPTPTEI